MLTTLKPFYYKHKLLLIFCILLFALTLLSSQVNAEHAQYAEQAHAWINQRLTLTNETCIKDCVKYNDRYYWTLGPLPSVVLLPFVYVLRNFSYEYTQIALNIAISVAVFILAYSLARKKNYSEKDSLYLGLSFVFASTYAQVAYSATSWKFAHAVTTLLMFLSLHEFFGKNRPWVTGTLTGLVLAARPTAALGIIFFFFVELFSNKNWKEKLGRLVLLLLPTIFVALLLLQYNHIRFDSYFENGYNTLAKKTYIPAVEGFYNKTISHNLFDIRHIPRNFAAYFPITLVNEGVFFLNLNFLLVSLPFIYVFRVKLKEKYVKEALATVLIILGALLSYYYAGWDQIGPRYTVDLLPFLYLLLLFSFKKGVLNNRIKQFIIFSSVFNYLCLGLLLLNNL